MVAACLLGASCATTQSYSDRSDVPRLAGMVARPSTCRVTGAWDVSGQPIEHPTVTRCVVPWYPPIMRENDQEGEIVIRVAIDSAGVPDSATFRVIRTSQDALVRAARAAVPYLQFELPESRSRIVVEMPFTFTLNR